MHTTVAMHATVMAGADANADAMFTSADIHLRTRGHSDAHGNEGHSDQEQFLHDLDRPLVCTAPTGERWRRSAGRPGLFATPRGTKGM
jgi:hypothetical protein